MLECTTQNKNDSTFSKLPIVNCCLWSRVYPMNNENIIFQLKKIHKCRTQFGELVSDEKFDQVSSKSNKPSYPLHLFRTL